MATWKAYDSLFRQAMTDDGSFGPFPYQRQLAQQVDLPAVLCVPTGAGKTAAVITAWLWRRHTAPEITPRRLVYTLPMRVLVEQTADTARSILRRLGLLYEGPPDPASPGVRVAVLMGGETDEDWWLEPERETILVGTLDMLLSRALNRGYALSRYRWPVDFGLLNSDALWVFDEVQLLGVGLYTGLQLQALRRRLGTFGRTHTLWCSATVDPAALHSVDHPAPAAADVLALGDEDRQHEQLRVRLTARKTIHELAARNSRRSGPRMAEAGVARSVLDAHRPGTRTLVVVNTVERAQRLHAELRRLLSPRRQAPELGLIHSRFRPQERMRLQQWLLSDVAPETPGRIVVATQVIEAGVDVSAATLFTEVAPWSSMVQRLGRCNRYGEVQQGARVFWMDVGEKETAPYEPEAMDEARRLLASLEGADVSPASLQRVASSAPTHERPMIAHVIRKRDLLGLFDTTPDLSGQHLDVSRFIREGADLDVLVYWRSWGEGDPPTALQPPSKEELCPVPVQEVRRFVEDPRRAAWLWDPLAGAGAGGWVRVRPNELRPGHVVLLRASDGGYSPETGWSRDVRSAVPVADKQASSQAARSQDSHDDDHYTTAPERWVTLETHTRDVMTELERSLARLVDLDLGRDAVQALRQAAAHHDVGKSHPAFQAPMIEALPAGEQALRRRCLWAKAPRLGNRSRRPFRHELASALAFLQAVADDSAEDEQADLVAFLIAGHHGKVRLAIRSLPAEKPPDREGVRFAQGIWDGDVLPRVTIDGLVQLPALALSLSLMELGLSEAGSEAFRSWSDRMLALRDSPRWGPFRLGFLEALLRAVDVRASMREKASSQEGKEGGEAGCHASS